MSDSWNNTGEQFLESTEWERALRWLSPLQFYTKHTDIIQKRTAATGLWLLEHPVFKKWATGEDPQGTLLCSGIRTFYPVGICVYAKL